jgi:hypothetical protein
MSGFKYCHRPSSSADFGNSATSGGPSSLSNVSYNPAAVTKFPNSLKSNFIFESWENRDCCHKKSDKNCARGNNRL